MEITRRRFLYLTGAAAGVTLLPAEFSELLGAVAQSERHWPGPGVETFVNSVCQLCPGGCGIRVRTLDGWPVRIQGNPDHPINRGGVCPKGAAGLQALYDPDRIRRPLRRVGERGSGRWKEIGWTEAIDLASGRLAGPRAAGRPESLVVIGGQYRGLMRSLWDRFLAAYGSPNYVSMPSGCEISDDVLRLTQGIDGPIGYDLEKASYVLSFGVSLLEGSWSPVWQMRAYAELRQGDAGRRAKIVQADTRFSVTAAKADEWLPVRPGSDGVLALGLAHVIVREGLFDRAFVGEHGSGFEDWTDGTGARREGFRSVVLRGYPPPAVAKATGIPVDRIERVAREFAAARPAVAMGDRGSARYANGLHTRWAIHCLNALVGSIDRPGGIVIPREVPFTPLPALAADPVAEQGRSRPRVDGAPGAPRASSAIHRLPEAIRSGRPYPVESVFLYYANPVFSLPGALGMRAALERVPFVVSFSPYHDESTRSADLVLPDHTFLERWQDDPTPRNVPFASLAIRQPVRAPLYDTRASSDVLLDLAKGLGGSIEAALPWKDTEAFLKERVQGVYDSGRGRLLASAGAADSSARLEPEGTLKSAPAPAARETSGDSFWTQLLEKGGWWDPDYRFEDWERTLRTASRKFEFLPAGDPAFLEGFTTAAPVGGAEEYPLLLNVFRPLPLTGGRTANMPYLLEIAGRPVSLSWESWAEIHPATARRHGIEDGDRIWVESGVGRIRLRARVHPGARPDVVSVPYGLGHEAGGRWAKGLGANPNDLLGAAALSVTGGSAVGLMRVKVYAA
jgi:anaerobic selenocysteine-containing dehydrogenase